MEDQQTPMQKPAPMAKPGKSKPKPNIWLITTIILAIALVAVLAVKLPQTGTKTDGDMTVVPPQEAADKLVDFVNQIYGAQIGTATLKEVSETSGLYGVKVEVSQAGQNTDQIIYITKDAKLFIPQALEMNVMLSQFEAFQQQQQQLQQQPPIVPAP